MLRKQAYRQHVALRDGEVETGWQLVNTRGWEVAKEGGGAARTQVSAADFIAATTGSRTDQAS